MARTKAKSTRGRTGTSPWQGTIRLALVFAALIGINVYIFYFRGGTSLRALLKRSGQHEVPTLIPPPTAPSAKTARAAAGSPPAMSGTTGATGSGARGDGAEVEVSDEGRVVTGTVGAADTLSVLLKRESVAMPTSGDIIAALTKVFDPRTVRAGHTYTLRFDGEDRLRAFEYRTTPATLFRVERTGGKAPRGAPPPEAPAVKEGWKAAKETAPLEVKVVEVGGAIESSLYDAVRRSGENTALVAFFVDMFAWDVNFYVDTQAGDTFKVIVEKLYLGDTFYKYGRVLAAEYSGRVGTFRAFWYQSPSDESANRGGGYYTERGESIIKSLLKTPLKFVRISSSFDRHRFHPILHTERAHLGVDYAAPTGTPVWATAGGRVAFRGNKGGAGECVIVAHPGGMESIYMHLSRFARGLEVGQTIRQKQVLGYVGMTGLATGPHLHFSVKIGGHFVDPLRLKPAREAPVPASQRAAFLVAVAPRIEALTRIEARAVPRAAVAHGADPAAAPTVTGAAPPAP